MSAEVTLTEAEREALACLCHASICPLHNEASDGYVEHHVDDLIAAVERIVAARVEQARAEAWDEGAYAAVELHNTGTRMTLRAVIPFPENPYREGGPR